MLIKLLLEITAGVGLFFFAKFGNLVQGRESVKLAWQFFVTRRLFGLTWFAASTSVLNHLLEVGC